MSQPPVTIAIPTYERAALLRVSLASALAQDYPELRVLVLDNASRDETEHVVRSTGDARLRYVRNETNLGMLGNLNRAVELNEAPYLHILFDDDVLLPGFLRASVGFLERHTTVGFTFTLARYIDAGGAPLHRADVDLPPGVVNGLEYIERNTRRRIGGSQSTVVMRASTLAAAGAIDSPHTKHTSDLNLYLRLARHADVGFLADELVQVRLHPGQASEREWGAARLGYEAEYIDAIAHLLRSPRARDASYREWLAERLLELNARHSEAIHPLVPGLHLGPGERLEVALREIAAQVPSGASYLLIDEQEWGPEPLPGRRALPFIERDGVYWGPPSEDAIAIHELERMRRAGAEFAVFGWPAFWWLEHYTDLQAHLRRHYRCALANRRAVIFDLRERRSSV